MTLFRFILPWYRLRSSSSLALSQGTILLGNVRFLLLQYVSIHAQEHLSRKKFSPSPSPYIPKDENFRNHLHRSENVQSNSLYAADISKIKESSTAHTILQAANIHSLPVEIRLTILHPMPDLPSLHALIHASASWRVYKSQGC